MFTADPGPEALVRAVRALHAVIVAEAATCTPDRFAGGWWLVLSGEAGVADIRTYRRAFSRLTLPAPVRKDFADGRDADRAPGEVRGDAD